MTRISKLRGISSTLSFKLFLLLFFSLLFLFSIHALVGGHLQSRSLQEQVRIAAFRNSDIIKQSLYVSMLRNERERTHTMITILGDEPGVEVIRIYNKSGEIKFSSEQSEIGTIVDLQAEACYACHASDQPLESVPIEDLARVYRGTEGYRILGLINPIRNDEGCSNGSCHAHPPDLSTLGVLDVQMSMEAVDGALASSRRSSFALALAIVSLSMLLIAGILYRAVHLPTRALRRATDALRNGNLDTQIDLQRSDELGELAQSFNRMARSLKEADKELRAWSRTLEERVKQKTEELEAIHQEIIQVEKTASLGKMAATVAHELNNPLTGIITYATLVARKLASQLPDGDEKGRILDNLELIRAESMRCGNIVRDLLTYARESRLEFGPENLHPLIDRALKLIEHHSELGEVEIVREFHLAEDSIVCDGEQIIQALLALLINATEAMPDGGQLSVATRRVPDDPSGRILISVRDTGVGIPEDVRERLFDPFFSTKSDTKGVGLGLAVVYGIVQRHEGEIHVHSAPGQGTEFILELPPDPEEVARKRAHRTGAVEQMT